ncbi:hypothetical protein LINPERHAP1_LOCUS74 [Linum perenne]
MAHVDLGGTTVMKSGGSGGCRNISEKLGASDSCNISVSSHRLSFQLEIEAELGAAVVGCWWWN